MIKANIEENDCWSALDKEGGAVLLVHSLSFLSSVIHTSDDKLTITIDREYMPLLEAAAFRLLYYRDLVGDSETDEAIKEILSCKQPRLSLK